jgi:hypothetical protein
MAINKITNAEREMVSVYGLPNKPGMSTEAIQQRFDGLGNLAIDKVNEVIEVTNQSSADIKDLDTRVDQIANNQIPEEYVQSAVETYVNNNQSELATKKNLEELDNQLSSEIVENKNDLTENNGYLYSDSDVIVSNVGFITKALVKNNNELWHCLFAPLKAINKNGYINLTNANLYFYGENIPSIAFYDEKKNLISAKFEAIYVGKITDIPDGTVYVLMNSSVGEFSVKLYSVLNRIDDVENESKNELLLEPCDSEVISGYGLYNSSTPFYASQNSAVRRFKIEKNKTYRFPKGNTSYRLVNGNPDTYTRFINSNGSSIFTNYFDMEYCYVDEVNNGTQIYGRELYKDNITNELNDFANINVSGKCNGNFVFTKIDIHKGDIIRAKRFNVTDSNALFLSNELRMSAEIKAKSLPFTDGYCEYVAEEDWLGFTSWSNGSENKSYLYSISIERKKGDTDKVVVCASNSSEWDKINADYVCTGTNDEAVINLAIDRVKNKVGTVVLCDGDYYIDSFNGYNFAGKTEKVAICVYSDVKGKGVSITGKSSGKPQGAKFYINESAFDGVSDDEIPSVFGGGSQNIGYVGGNGFNLSHVRVEIPNHTHKCIVVNYQHLYWGILDSCTLVVKGYGQDVIPTENLIGVRGWAGWSDGSVIGAYDTYANGFRVGFQLGGEHVICERLGTRYCYTSYSFGEYPLDAGSGAQVHPITLINCCDEHQATLPKFYNSGNADSRNAGRCQVDFIGFNIEYYPLITGTPIVGAMEEVDGGWVGRIEYSTENNENNANVALPFWADGHGKNFRTLNTAQCQMGTTALRNTFAPNYMQQYYDTDLNKVVFCKEPSTNTWIDANGNIV